MHAARPMAASAVATELQVVSGAVLVSVASTIGHSQGITGS